MIQITRNQVPTPAASASDPPAATGRRYTLLAPRKLAVIAASTRIVSSPSRNTRIAESITTVVRHPVRASVGSVVPPLACQLKTTIRTAPIRTTAVQM